MKKFLVIALVALLFSACKKDSQPVTSDPDPGTNTDPSAAKHKLVSKVVTTQSNGDIVEEYVYNDQNQLVEMHWGGNSPTFIHSDFVLTYNTDGTLKRQVRTSGAVTEYRDIEYENGMPTLITNTRPSDSSYDYKIKLNTGDSKVLGGTWLYTVNGVDKVNSIVTFEYSNENLIKQTNDFGTYKQESISDFGIKNNAFRYTGNKLLLSSAPVSHTNDLLKMVTTTGDKTQTKVFTNTYDEQGYPKTIKTNSTTTEPGEATYSYETTAVYTYIDAK
ncbi:hypothetical protein GWR56_16115 [Mucilaginibacter sp. 14171R-50]|uniref:hypothetical protein n=1 Tax=Mucilaginibacter sp. 14171R-50 TaxID=2703789 RepID=UPI00138C049F|nr:hypothetical protein [Mucilaginibacter sp. 14171R-50]QHS56992.1 hypothetical protein GWR56_16115 [Mucilaginibacter sp. 14171R-50]